jgi:hypothetical protein
MHLHARWTHTYQKRSLLVEIVISRQGEWLDPEAANDLFVDVFGHVLAELV